MYNYSAPTPPDVLHQALVHATSLTEAHYSKGTIHHGPKIDRHAENERLLAASATAGSVQAPGLHSRSNSITFMARKDVRQHLARYTDVISLYDSQDGQQEQAVFTSAVSSCVIDRDGDEEEQEGDGSSAPSPHVKFQLPDASLYSPEAEDEGTPQQRLAGVQRLVYMQPAQRSSSAGRAAPPWESRTSAAGCEPGPVAGGEDIEEEAGAEGEDVAGVAAMGALVHGMRRLSSGADEVAESPAGDIEEESGLPFELSQQDEAYEAVMGRATLPADERTRPPMAPGSIIATVRAPGRRLSRSSSTGGLAAAGQPVEQQQQQQQEEVACSHHAEPQIAPVASASHGFQLAAATPPRPPGLPPKPRMSTPQVLDDESLMVVAAGGASASGMTMRSPSPPPVPRPGQPGSRAASPARQLQQQQHSSLDGISSSPLLPPLAPPAASRNYSPLPPPAGAGAPRGAMHAAGVRDRSPSPMARQHPSVLRHSVPEPSLGKFSAAAGVQSSGNGVGAAAMGTPPRPPCPPRGAIASSDSPMSLRASAPSALPPAPAPGALPPLVAALSRRLSSEVARIGVPGINQPLPAASSRQQSRDPSPSHGCASAAGSRRASRDNSPACRGIIHLTDDPLPAAVHAGSRQHSSSGGAQVRSNVSRDPSPGGHSAAVAALVPQAGTGALRRGLERELIEAADAIVKGKPDWRHGSNRQLSNSGSEITTSEDAPHTRAGRLAMAQAANTTPVTGLASGSLLIQQGQQFALSTLKRS